MLGGVGVLEEWEAQGERVLVGDEEVWFRDVGPAGNPGANPPLLVLHGYPSSSYDYCHVLDALRTERRVVLVDFGGFGLSAKPDRRYSIRRYADEAAAVIAHLGVAEVDLLTHDMGDTVGGELLARELDGVLAFSVRRRVLTNGSIYIDMAHLTAGQQLLLSLPDERAALADEASFKAAMAATMAPEHQPSSQELDAMWTFMSRLDGHTLLPRSIRYIEDRRAEERRFTGAIETHPAPLGIVWGELDPIAVLPMTDVLLAARSDASRTVLDGVGHYPMVEAPDRFAEAVLAHL